jgi:hypothetical protein
MITKIILTLLIFLLLVLFTARFTGLGNKK